MTNPRGEKTNDEGWQCPRCDRVLKSKAGLTRHLNDIHLIMSPTQVEQMNKTLPKSHQLATPKSETNDKSKGSIRVCGMPGNPMNGLHPRTATPKSEPDEHNLIEPYTATGDVVREHGITNSPDELDEILAELYIGNFWRTYDDETKKDVIAKQMEAPKLAEAKRRVTEQSRKAVVEAIQKMVEDFSGEYSGHNSAAITHFVQTELQDYLAKAIERYGK